MTNPIDFERDVLVASKTKPILVDLWATWCGPCRVLTPLLESLDASDDRWTLVKIDTDANPKIAATLQVRAVPSVRLFVDSEEKASFNGALPEAEIKKWLNEHLPSERKEKRDAAETAMKEGRFDDALPHLEELHRAAPADKTLCTMLAQAVLARNPDRAEELVASIDHEGHEGFQTAEAIRTFVRLIRDILPVADATPNGQRYRAGIQAWIDAQPAQAFESWLDVIREGRKLDDDGAKKACVAGFHLLGKDNEIVQEYRRRFASLLF